MLNTAEPWQDFFQCLLAALSVLVLLLVLNAAENSAVIAALGASSFIAFTLPKAKAGRPRFLIGGYVTGIIAALVCYGISQLPMISNIAVSENVSCAFFGAMTVGLAIFLMVILDLEHPPAAAVALGLALNKCELRIIGVVLIGIVLLVLIRRLLRPFLIDLL